MIAALDTEVLSEASDLIAERMGLYFPQERWPDLARGLETASHEMGFDYPDACLYWLRSQELTTRQVETLSSYLTVGETYFLRDPESFEALQREILPPLIANRSEAGRTLRLWSAGCCTGEEAYSLAIACARTLPEFSVWNVSILATDINPKFLAKAEAGIYGEWSFRGAPRWLRERFFSPAPNKMFSIDPTIKNLVHFDHLNLAVDVYPSLPNLTNAMDVIFCRNVIMYFSPEHQRRVVASLYRCLVEGGCLLVNPAEAGASLFPMFAMEEIGGVIFFRKTTNPLRCESWQGFVAPMSADSESVPLFIDAPAKAAPVEPASPTAPPASATPNTASSRVDPFILVRTYANQGRLEEALEACQETIAAERYDPVAHFLHATICNELGHYEKAIVSMNKVLYLDQDFILAHHALGGLHRQLGQMRESKRHFAITLKILSSKGKDEIVPESDGMTCGRLMESIQAMTGA